MTKTYIIRATAKTSLRRSATRRYLVDMCKEAYSVSVDMCNYFFFGSYGISVECSEYPNFIMPSRKINLKYSREYDVQLSLLKDNFMWL